MIKRTGQNQLTDWFNSVNRKPLLLRGARQVGKSTLVRQWALEQGFKLAEINLERHLRLTTVFKQNDIEAILKEIEIATGMPLNQPHTLLFIDEIQAIPEALATLRYFYEDKPELPVLAAGSLLEFVLADHEFSMPVGRIEYLHVGPLSFTEFLDALHKDLLEQTVANFENGKKIPLTAHHELLKKQREFFFVGGMPEAVAIYQDSLSPLESRKIHRSIIQTYQDDFSKYGRRVNIQLLHKIFDAMPRIVGNKIKYAAISSEHRSAEIKQALDMLIKARLLLPCYHSDCSGLPLRAGRDERILKTYFLDVGLFNYLCGLDWNNMAKLDERELFHEGKLAEQFTAQHMAYRFDGHEAPELFYWLRENRSANAEVDFVIAWDQQIIPVEVKSGKSGRLRSLQQFMHHKKIPKALRFDLNQPDIQTIHHHLTGTLAAQEKQTVSFKLISWPLYLVERLGRVSI